MNVHVSAAIIRNMMSVGRSIEFYDMMSIDGPGFSVRRKLNAVDEADPFGIVGTKGYNGPGVGSGMGRYLHPAFHLGRVERQVS